MANDGVLRRLYHSFRQPLRVLAQPVSSDRGRGWIMIQPYRGFGSRNQALLMGRVFRLPPGGRHLTEGGLVRDVVDIVRRSMRWGIAHSTVVARFYGAQEEVRTDRAGYFCVRIRPGTTPPADRLWHETQLELPWHTDEPITATGLVYIPPPASRSVVISDIDDTVVFTGVANKVLMLWRLFFQGPRSRIAFPGVSALYRALHGGPGGDQDNPMLYVSRGPWAIYELLDEFFRLHEIPVGPVLFLRQWGLTPQSPLPRRQHHFKRDLIRTMLDVYNDRPVVLIGDSGQKDPEIYARIVREHPGRVRAVYIRNVSRKPDRVRAIEDLAARVAEADSALVLASDSFAMAADAAERGLISPDVLTEVLAEREAEKGAPALKATRRIRPADAAATREAIGRGELDKALAEPTEGETPPNVVVEPQRKEPEQQPPDANRPNERQV